MVHRASAGCSVGPMPSRETAPRGGHLNGAGRDRSAGYRRVAAGEFVDLRDDVIEFFGGHTVAHTQ